MLHVYQLNFMFMQESDVFEWKIEEKACIPRPQRGTITPINCYGSK